MLTELIDAYLEDNSKSTPKGYTGLRHVYMNEDVQRVYMSNSGSVFPNKFLFWTNDI